jgi:hypothetical protein
VHLIFFADSIKECMIHSMVSTSTDCHYDKTLPSKTAYEKLSPCFAFRPHDVIQHILQQATQLAKSTIHFPI